MKSIPKSIKIMFLLELFFEFPSTLVVLAADSSFLIPLTCLLLV